jgi:hypothetical protein
MLASLQSTPKLFWMIVFIDLTWLIACIPLLQPFGTIINSTVTYCVKAFCLLIVFVNIGLIFHSII